MERGGGVNGHLADINGTDSPRLLLAVYVLLYVEEGLGDVRLGQVSECTGQRVACGERNERAIRLHSGFS